MGITDELNLVKLFSCKLRAQALPVPEVVHAAWMLASKVKRNSYVGGCMQEGDRVQMMSEYAAESKRFLPSTAITMPLMSDGRSGIILRRGTRQPGTDGVDQGSCPV